MMSRRRSSQNKKEGIMSLRLTLAVLFGVLFGGAVAITMLAPRAPTSGTLISADKPLIGGAFALTDTTGNRVSDKDFAGKPMLVYFGYTNCPDICPAGLQIISQALDKLGPKSAKLSTLFISLDPERDTPSVLGSYMKSFHPSIIGLTGSADEMESVAKAYKVYHKKVVLEESAAQYSIDHTGFMYLMDGKGEYLKHFPHNVAVDTLAAEIEKAL